MKKTLLSKSLCTLLALTFVYVLLFSDLPNAKAANNNYVNIMHKVSTAAANSPILYNFSLNRKSDIYFIIKENECTGVTVSVKEPVHDTPIETIYLPASNPNWKYDKQTGIYTNTATSKLDAGNYILELSFEQDVNFDLSMNQMSQNPTLSKKSITITKGFRDTIKVNGGKIKSCSSNNKSIATVTDKGKITAKKNGTTKIKVKLTNGKTLTCKVTVVSNKFSAKKINVENTQFNTCAMKPYAASFDKKGNLVVKFKIVNNSYGQITKIPSFRILIKNSSKKTIVNYKDASYKVTIPSYKDKSCTVTIPKSKLAMKKNKVDLRTSKISITGDFADASL